MTEKSYITFKEHLNYSGKTKKFHIVNIKHNEDIGEIYWDFGWRQYVWSSYNSIKWSEGCTQDVVNFVHKLNEERKEAKK